MTYTIIDCERMLDELHAAPRGKVTRSERRWMRHLYKRHANLWRRDECQRIEKIWNKVFNP